MKRLLVLFCALLVSGCVGSPAPSPVLNLSYSGTAPSGVKRDIKIGIIEAAYTGTNPLDKLASSPLLAMAGASNPSGLPFELRVNSEYQKNCLSRLKSSLTADLERILADKGFKIANKYDSYDVVPYAEKKDIDLILVPRFDFGPAVKNTRKQVPFMGYVDSGSIQLVGRMEIDLIEPLSREKIIIKKIDVAASSEYAKAEEGLNALVTLLNTTYPQLLSRASALLDADEIVNASKDIAGLKKKNQ